MMGAVNDIREANRASPLFTHLTTVSEGISVLGWVTIEPKPADYVTEVLSSAQFYGNRIIKEYKEKSVPGFLAVSQRILISGTETVNMLNGSMHFTTSSNL